MQPVDLLVTNASMVLTLDHGRPGPVTGEAMRDLKAIAGGAVAIDGGKIVAVGPAEDLTATFEAARVVDADGHVVMPGFVDPHTHLVFPAFREDEFVMRCLGKSYEEIAAAGGGIRNSARRMREASRDDLLARAKNLRRSALLHGTTTIEAKSGYGLETEAEILSLEVAGEVDDRGDVVRTFLGAHEVPDEYRDDRETYIRIVVDQMLPRVVDGGLAEFCDVFCEEAVFTTSESRRILGAAADAGLGVKMHADELHPTGGAELAAELGAISADHLIRVSDAGIAAMAEAGVVATLLPGTSFFLGMKHFAPGRKMIDAGGPVALATDCNPGSSMTENMQFILTAACLGYGFTPEEAITAATINAAHAVGRGDVVGSLAPGKRADLLVLDVPNPRLMAYHHGVNHVRTVIHHGEIVT
ncbi:MAG: imidazolonepropionase [Planctomycetota bacterium]